MSRIIIIGASHHNTLSVVRCIGEVFGQVELVVVGCARSYISKSKYVYKATFLHKAEALYTWVKGCQCGERGIIISCADSVTQVLDAHYTELHQYFDFFNAGADGVLSTFMNKQIQVELAKTVGFATPYSVCYSSKNFASASHVFPCIVKPLQSYVGGKHIWICNNSEELKSVFDKMSDGIMYQEQELITNEHEIVLPGLITKERIIIPGYIVKHREILGGTTYSTVKRHNLQTNKLITYSEKLLRKIGYVGLFGIEAIYNGKEYVFIELNLRNDATCYSLAVAGVNLPAMYVYWVLGKEIKITQISEIKSIVENKDFSHVIRKNIGFIQWLKDLRNAQCKYLYNKHDMKPMFACLFDQIINKIKK